MNHEFTCDLCCGVVHTLSVWRSVDHLDGAEFTCPDCGAVGRFSVDADEDGAWCVFRANPGEPPGDAVCGFHAAGNEGRCNYCER